MPDKVRQERRWPRLARGPRKNLRRPDSQPAASEAQNLVHYQEEAAPGTRQGERNPDRRDRGEGAAGWGKDVRKTDLRWALSPALPEGFLSGQSCGHLSGSKNPTQPTPLRREESWLSSFLSSPGFATASSCAGPRRRLSRDSANPAPKPLCLGVPGADDPLHTSLMAPPEGTRPLTPPGRAENLQPTPLTRGHLSVLSPNHCPRPSGTPSSLSGLHDGRRVRRLHRAVPPTFRPSNPSRFPGSRTKGAGLHAVCEAGRARSRDPTGG